MDGALLEGNGTYEIESGQLVIIAPDGIPSPDVELYSVKNGFTQLYAKGFNVSFLEVMITAAMLDSGDVAVGVFYPFAHRIYKFEKGKMSKLTQMLI